MDTTQLIVIVVAIAVIAIAAWMILGRKRSVELRNRFGPEYGDAVREFGDRRRAEADLARREKRVEKFHIHELPPNVRERFLDAWKRNQAHFVDDPADAIAEADTLVCEVMKARGYPMTDFDIRAADLSVDYPHVIRNYRTAHEIAVRQKRGQTSTEDLRQAMIHYRELVAELLPLQSVRQEVH